MNHHPDVGAIASAGGLLQVEAELSHNATVDDGHQLMDIRLGVG